VLYRKRIEGAIRSDEVDVGHPADPMAQCRFASGFDKS
jgi:hypothetical protein